MDILNVWVLLSALVVVVAVLAIGAYVVKNTPDTANVEISRIRLAAASLTGILLLVVLVMVLYVVKPDGSGAEIFKIAFPALSSLAGVIIGYVFGKQTQQPST
jgi:cytochrome bd-type quinol oxidase subunit 2